MARADRRLPGLDGDEVERFEAHWPIGARERLALDLYTGWRPRRRHPSNSRAARPLD